MINRTKPVPQPGQVVVLSHGRNGLRSAPEQRALEAERPAGARGELRVLVVDDNHDAADSLAMLLEMDGHHSRVAHDGAQALALAQTFAPEVALLDIGLPGMDGYELARALRERLGPSLLLVALTGWSGDDAREQALAQGFDVHMTKPADPLEIDRLLLQRARAR
jgi:CheY-like chemotaxis protein